jgi:hypothetical protein
MTLPARIASAVFIGTVIFGAPSHGVVPVSAEGEQMPMFVWDPTWPKAPLLNNWTLGHVTGVAVDAKDHVWILQRPFSISHDMEDGLEHNPPTASCCRMAPRIIEFDQAGNLGSTWGGPEEKTPWPIISPDKFHVRRDALDNSSGEHSLYIDHTGHFWISIRPPNVLKFTNAGKLVLTIGGVDPGKGSNDTTGLGGPAGIFVDAKANELYIADGYQNRRVIVFDANTGAYKRHWGAYGKPPDDSTKEKGCLPGKVPSQFSTPHAVRLSNDGFVYVSDRFNCRIQVFKPDGTYIKETFFELASIQGSAWDVGFSPDKDQRFLYALDGGNKKVWILRRNDLKVLGSLGCGGHQGGCFYAPHTIAVDSKGNIYIGEVQEGKRVQRFLYKGLGPTQVR